MDEFITVALLLGTIAGIITSFVLLLILYVLLKNRFNLIHNAYWKGSISGFILWIVAASLFYFFVFSLDFGGGSSGLAAHIFLSLIVLLSVIGFIVGGLIVALLVTLGEQQSDMTCE